MMLGFSPLHLPFILLRYPPAYSVTSLATGVWRQPPLHCQSRASCLSGLAVKARIAGTPRYRQTSTKLKRYTAKHRFIRDSCFMDRLFYALDLYRTWHHTTLIFSQQLNIDSDWNYFS